jgi:diguanylate cyclase (GGDEF)-like protein
VLRDVARIEAEENRLLALRRAAYAAADARAEGYGLALAGAGAAMLALLVLSGVTALRAHGRAVAATAELQRMATTDALTGLWNRRHLLERLEAEAARSRRSGRPLCLAVLDVDHFKRVNDQHGHPAGDEVLRVLAAAIKDAVRTSDVVGRMGGEEFAVLMPETDRAQARIVCERLRKTVGCSPVRLPSGESLDVTLSTGVALMAGEEGSDRLISRADAALYAAKADGRNRVRLAA